MKYLSLFNIDIVHGNSITHEHIAFALFSRQLPLYSSSCLHNYTLTITAEIYSKQWFIRWKKNFFSLFHFLHCIDPKLNGISFIRTILQLRLLICEHKSEKIKLFTSIECRLACHPTWIFEFIRWIMVDCCFHVYSASFFFVSIRVKWFFFLHWTSHTIFYHPCCERN